ncbi:AAA family ATPase, partial [Candidatus Woesearchaeota archaeon]|nr:AAA family ATPase [Candidatus Woesearchaeota archaeon]
LGIASGDVTLDNIGNEVRSEITSSGNPIIDSARLMAADNQDRILASTATYGLLDQKFRFSEAIPVKGKTKQESGLTAYSPLERKLQPGRVNIFGRDSIQFTLQQRYSSVKDGNAACLLLEGDEGVGKTALLNNFHLDLEESEGIKPIHLIWDTQKRTLPFGLVTELFKHIYNISDNDIKSKSLSLADRIAMHSREIGINEQTITNAIRAASYLFEIHFDGYKEFESAEEARDIINDAFSHVINSEAAFNKSPYVLLLDNANLLDNYSLGALKYICDNLAGRIMVVLGQRLTAAKTYSDKTEILPKLDKLDRDSLIRIIKLVIGDDYIKKIDSADIEEIVGQSEGNPGHAKEIALRLRQYFIQHPSLDKLPSEEIKRLPPKIFDIVLDRIRSLDKHLYDYLCVAAVATAGHNYFYHEDLMAYVDRVPTEAELKLLEELNIIRKSRARTYEFVNSRIPDALRATIPSDKKNSDRREGLHEAFADSLAARYQGREEDVVDKIAWHLANARYSRRAEALPLLERAAKKKLGLYANEAAVELERNAIQIMYDLLGTQDGFTAGNVMKTCQLLEDLVRYSLESRDYGIVEQSLLRTKKLLGDAKQRSVALPQEYVNSQEFMRAVRLSEVYALRSPDIRDRDEKKRGLARADRVCKQTLTLAESVEANPESSEKDRRNLASFYLHRGEIRRYNSQLIQQKTDKTIELEQAINDYIKTIELCEINITRLGTTTTSFDNLLFYKRVRFFGYNNKALAQHEKNDLDGAIRTYDQAIELAKDLNDKKYLAQVLINLGAAYYSKNELAACLAMFKRAYQVAKDGHRSSDIIMAGFNTVMTYVLKFLKDSGIKDAKDLDDSTEASLSAALEGALSNLVKGKPLQPLQDALRLIEDVRPLAIRRRSSWFVEALTRYESGINYLLKNYN